MILTTTLLSSALFGLNASDSERIEKLKTYFDPAPGNIVQISAENLKTSNRAHINKLRGYILVTPPKNYCFQITRNHSLPSDYVCKQTPLAFDLTDIDRDGKIVWEVKTSLYDVGTVVRWQTPYRTIIAIPRKRSSDASTSEAGSENYGLSEPPQYLPIESCNDLSNKNTRRIEIRLFNGESWRFHFPSKHKLLPQPEGAPNLQISIPSGRRTIAEVAEDRKTKPPEEPPEMQKQSAEEKREEIKAKNALPNMHEDRKIWAISLRNSYEMSSENFHPNNTNTSGDRGICRYNFYGPKEDPTTGRIECQNTAEYHTVLVPVTCIAAVKGDND